MQTLKKLVCVKLGIDWTSAPLSYSQTFGSAKTSGSTMGVYLTQHLHAVASSIVKPSDDPFVSTAMADACPMLNLVCLFMKPHVLAVL